LAKAWQMGPGPANWEAPERRKMNAHGQPSMGLLKLSLAG